jgi:hypothetical protein
MAAVAVAVPVTVAVPVSVPMAVPVTLPVIIPSVTVAKSVSGSDRLAVAAGCAPVTVVASTTISTTASAARARRCVWWSLSTESIAATLVSNTSTGTEPAVAKTSLESSSSAIASTESTTKSSRARRSAKRAWADRARRERFGISTTTKSAAETTRLPAFHSTPTFHIH